MAYNFNSDAYFSSYSGETTPKLTAYDLSVTPTFSEETDTSFIFEYITRNEIRYMHDIDNLKSGNVRIRGTETANKMFNDIYGEFKDKIDSVEIFDVIIRYFGFDEKDFFDKLIKPSRMILINDLSKRINIG